MKRSNATFMLSLFPAILSANSYAQDEKMKTDLSLMAPSEEAAELAQECALCHFDFFLGFLGSTHNAKEVSCPVCHGESKGHREAENNDVKPSLHFRTKDRKKKVENLCLACHAKTVEQVRAGSHNEAPRPDAAQPAECIPCHDPHK